MVIPFASMLRRFGILQQRRTIPHVGSILGASLGAAVGSVILKKVLFSRRAAVEANLSSDSLPAKPPLQAEPLDQRDALVPSPEEDVTPPHGDLLSRSVNTVSYQ